MAFYSYQTRIGEFKIIQKPNGFWSPFYDDESLGDYVTPHQAAEDLARGHADSIANCLDISVLEIPDDLGEWKKVFR